MAQPSSHTTMLTERMSPARPQQQRHRETQGIQRDWRYQPSMPALPTSWCLWVISTLCSTLSSLTPRAGLLCLIYLICSLRTNIVFFVIFLSLILAFGFLGAAYYNLALYYENPSNLHAAATAKKMVVVSGPSPVQAIWAPELIMRY